MDMKRVEEIEQKLETILNFDTNSSTKLSQSSMTHEEHHSLLLELLEEDVLTLAQTIKQQQEEVKDLEETRDYLNSVCQVNRDTIKQQQEQIERYEEALKEITNVGWSESFGGGIQYSGESHGDCIKIAKKALEHSP